MLGVSETKVQGNGEKQIGNITCEYSGVQEGRTQRGAVILLSVTFGAF